MTPLYWKTVLKKKIPHSSLPAVFCNCHSIRESAGGSVEGATSSHNPYSSGISLFFVTYGCNPFRGKKKKERGGCLSPDPDCSCVCMS